MEQHRTTDARVRAAEAQDIGQLGIIGPAACAEAYAGFWDRPDAYARHLATFGPDSFADLLARPDAHLWVAEVNGTVVGHCALVTGSADPIEARANGAELSRLYLIGPARALGLGRKLLEVAAARARRDGAAYLWLEAMTAADRLVDAYARCGFREIGRTRFGERLKPGLSGMVVMAMELG